MVLIHPNLKYLQVYKYDIPFGPGTQATRVFGGLFKWVLRTFLYTQWGKSNQGVILFICYCWVINDHKSSSLKQCILSISQCMWVRGLNTALCLGSHKAAVKSSATLHSPGSLAQEESASKLIKVVDRIHFLATVGLRAFVSCWLLAGDCPQLLEATHGFLPHGLSRHGCLLHQAIKESLWGMFSCQAESYRTLHSHMNDIPSPSL